VGDQDSDDEGGPGGLAARESLVEYARRRRDGRAATEKARAHRRQEQRSAGLGGAVARAWQARRGLGKVAMDVLGSSLHQRYHEGSHGHGHGSEVEVDEDEALRRLRLRLVRHHKSHRSASDLLEVRVAGPARPATPACLHAFTRPFTHVLSKTVSGATAGRVDEGPLRAQTQGLPLVAQGKLQTKGAGEEAAELVPIPRCPRHTITPHHRVRRPSQQWEETQNKP